MALMQPRSKINSMQSKAKTVRAAVCQVPQEGQWQHLMGAQGKQCGRPCHTAQGQQRRRPCHAVGRKYTTHGSTRPAVQEAVPHRAVQNTGPPNNPKTTKNHRAQVRVQALSHRAKSFRQENGQQSGVRSSILPGQDQDVGWRPVHEGEGCKQNPGLNRTKSRGIQNNRR